MQLTIPTQTTVPPKRTRSVALLFVSETRAPRWTVDLHRIGTVGSSQHNDSMCSKPTSELSDRFCDVLGRGEVDKMLRAGFQDEILLASSIDADDPESDAF